MESKANNVVYGKGKNEFRVWRDYGALLRECKCEPGVTCVTDASRSRVFFEIPVG